MHIRFESTFPGIEDRVLHWSARERAVLERAAGLLARAREAAGPETDLGCDLGKGEVVLRDYLDGAVLETRTYPLA